MQRWDLRSIDAPRGTLDPYVVYQDEGARAVLIALEPGQELREHQVKENAWVAVVDGTVQASAGGDTVELGPGGLLRFDPGERHALASRDGARILLLLTPWPAAGHFPP
jgi:quercetin dioxygenase-like cupin family protein